MMLYVIVVHVIGVVGRIPYLFCQSCYDNMAVALYGSIERNPNYRRSVNPVIPTISHFEEPRNIPVPPVRRQSEYTEELGWGSPSSRKKEIEDSLKSKKPNRFEDL